tara:strand:+ start:1290 stop:2033 length:744 start_codon:yes stop_codon:yes gene_type:complete
MVKEIILLISLSLSLNACEGMSTIGAEINRNDTTLINKNDTTLINNYPTSLMGDTIYHRNGYSFSYNEKYEQPNWVQYTITPQDLTCEVKAKRKNNFKKDNSVSTESATLKDYKGSGYDRGHLKASADESCNQQQMDETFLMSNMSPQDPGFNRGIWKKLEGHVRYLALTNDSIRVITGGDLSDSLEVIGDNRVGIPKFYFKVLYVFNGINSDIIGYYLPNQKIQYDLGDYILNIEEIEHKTEIIFP